MRLKIEEAKSKKLKESISSSDFNYLLDTFEDENKHNEALKNVSVSYKGNTVIFSGLSKEEAENLVEDLEEHVAWSLEADTSASIKEDGTVYITVYEDETESKKMKEDYNINTLSRVVEDLIVQAQRIYNPEIASILQSNGIKVRNERGYLGYYLDSADQESLRSAGRDLIDYINSNDGYIGPDIKYMLEESSSRSSRKSDKKLREGITIYRKDAEGDNIWNGPNEWNTGNTGGKFFIKMFKDLGFKSYDDILAHYDEFYDYIKGSALHDKDPYAKDIWKVIKNQSADNISLF